ncbi:MAG: putative inner membrane protein [Candidatus Accumulibacter appositus]|uniref:Putative inner membrane protein n=1 Tax=Candidatus Accumulibacter appositus TaxID=1454003 RepID=A0A011NLQ8_9PROT|nr:AI-2E family transporter [Accumulibacter sp.]EXI76221.1 MAG: putative inner membrane protein [Candidatus Accumulibacter appositus]HRF06395.1 AI-2E family transporter [Accumulibacter sp.]
MNRPFKPDLALEKRLSDKLLDVFIRAGLVIALVMLCYRIFSPFLGLMMWALILAITLYPLHQKLAGSLGGRQGRAATLLVLAGIALIVVPTALLASSMGDSIHQLIGSIKDNTFAIPAPPAKVADWPLVGEKLAAAWSMAHSDLPAFMQKLQPQIGDLAKKALGMVASIGSGMLMFLFSFIIAGVIMAFGESGERGARAIFDRVVGKARGEELNTLSTATVRAVAMGVIGVAFIQAIIVGLALLVAGIPWAGVLALLMLLLGIAQVPALLITLPAIGYMWTMGDYETVAAVSYSVLLVVAGMADNVLKPLMLGRGVDAPMPVVLLGALGGMAATGILGMFVGATLLALGYQIFMGWVEARDEVEPAEDDSLPVA